MLKDSSLLKLFGLSLKSCVRECEARPACLSINFRRMSNECHLNDKDGDPLEKTPGFVYLKMKVSLRPRNNYMAQGYETFGAHLNIIINVY